MPIDIFTTVFEVKGVAALFGAFERVANAQNRLTIAENRLAQAQARLNRTQPNTPQRLAAERSVENAMLRLENVTRTARMSQIDLGNIAIQNAERMATALQAAIDKYAEFGKKVMDLRDQFGLSGSRAASASIAMAGAGIQNPASILQSIQSDLFSEQGRIALSRIGVAASPHGDVLATFERVKRALDTYPAGLQKSKLMTDLFGGSLQQVLPYLRMSAGAMTRLQELGRTFGERSLGNIQRYEERLAIAQQSLMVNVVFPVAERVLPIFTKLLILVDRIADAFIRLDRATGGSSTWLMLGLAIGTVVAAFARLISALRLTAIWSAVIAGLTGNWKNLAIGIGAGAAVGFGGMAISKWLDEEDSKGQENDKFSRAVDRFSIAVQDWSDGLRYNKGNIPSGLDKSAFNELARMGAMGVIG